MAQAGMPEVQGSTRSSSRSSWWKLWELSHQGDAIITITTWASTRCGRRSSTRFDEPRRWINSGGLGTMGVGLPYAMGIVA